MLQGDQERSNDLEILEEVDNEGAANVVEEKAQKKGNTLTRLFKGIRKSEEEKQPTESETDTNSAPVTKIFQRMNPVGKTNRDNVFKVFHRIGDAFKRKGEEDKGTSSKADGKGSERDKKDEMEPRADTTRNREWPIWQ